MLDPHASGTMRTGTDKEAKDIGTVAVSFTRNMEPSDVSGKPYILPRAELRLNVEVWRDGDRIAVAKIPLDDIAENLAEFTMDYVQWKTAATART